jgi:eukaryotic-like serine/threonine-protein kinase
MASGSAASRVGALLLEKYRLTELLAVGGMGEVYRAENIAVERPVAIKILRRELLADEGLVRRFINEGKAANRVQHPCIVPVLDLGRDGDQVFIVQDLLEGEDLGKVLKRGDKRVGLDEALEILVPVADALGAAHDNGLVHRDLKPANVFLAAEGERRVPKLLDFGVAKFCLGDPDGDTPLTHTGSSIGTPAYMSPEQITDPRNVDARADVWALGVLLHRMLAGKMPFKGNSPGAVMVAICTAPHRRLADALPSAPEALVDIVDCCLQKDPAARFATGRAVARALVELRELMAEEISGYRARDASVPRLLLPDLELEAPPSRTPSTLPPPPSQAPSHERVRADTPRLAVELDESRVPVRSEPPVIVPSVSSTRLRPDLVPLPPPAATTTGEAIQLAAAGLAIGVALAFGWTLAAYRGIGGLAARHGMTSAGVVAVVAAAGAARCYLAGTRGVALSVAAAGFAAVAVAAVGIALTLHGNDVLPGWQAYAGMLSVAAACGGVGAFGLRRAYALATARPPRLAFGAGVGVASVVAMAAAIRMLL